MLFSDKQGYIYIKTRNNLRNLPYFTALVKNFSFDEDIMAISTSEFELFQTPPPYVEIGDVILYLGPDSKTLYQGVIDSIEKNKITCKGIYQLLDYSIMIGAKGETVKKTTAVLGHLLERAKWQCVYKKEGDSVETKDYLLYDFFASFVINEGFSNDYEILASDDGTSLNIVDEIFNLHKRNTFNKIVIPFGKDVLRATTYVVAPKAKYKLTKNNYVLNINVKQEVSNVNKVLLCSKDYTKIRNCAYLTKDGRIVSNPREAREVNIKQKIIAQDEGNSWEVCSNELVNEQLSHEIEVEILYDNPFWQVNNSILGTRWQIDVEGKVFDSICTGYKMETENGQMPTTVTLVFGKGRTAFSKRRKNV